MKYVADFETITDPSDCRVWAWGVTEVLENDDQVRTFYDGNNIETFIQWCKGHTGNTLYFHNLKFDGEFIIYWLLNNGYTYTEKRNPNSHEFSTLISDKGMFYSIKICFGVAYGKKQSVKILDSHKILPFSVDAISKAFGLKDQKLKIDYDEYREEGHILTDEERDYLHNDLLIPAEALRTLFEQGLTQMTQGSNALADYKETIGKKNFERWFPTPDYDEDIRQAYKGGFTYLNPKYRTIVTKEGIVLDVNSLYPYVMRNKFLPYGEGKFFEGKYEKDDRYPLYVQKLSCSFELKEGYIPTLQLKNNLSFIPTQYLESSNGEDVELVLTNIDLELLFEHYDVYDVQYYSGWKFRSSNNMFVNYIDKWVAIKIQAEKEGNKGLRTLAKLMLNALYGKFGLNPNVRSKSPYLDENGVVKYKLGKKEKRKPIYIPIAVFVTAYARQITITAAQSNYDRFIYSDTDSLHLEGLDEPDGMWIHPTELGAWKHESTFVRGKYIRSKSYIEDEVSNTFYLPELDLYGKTELKITCAGLPKSAYENVTFDNFKEGATYGGKLGMKHVKGGIVLAETPFTIKK